MATPAFERYWSDAVTNGWNVDNGTWLTSDRLAKGNFESSQDCYMTLQPNGEIWEYCRDPKRSLDGKAPFVVSKYRSLTR